MIFGNARRCWPGLSGCVFALLVAGMVGRAFCADTEVSNISGQDYFTAVMNAVGKANVSICMAMYILDAPSEPADAKSNLLIDELISARKRGVAVDVFLDQDLDGVRNVAAARRLKDAGIGVFFAEPGRVLHAKGIVIDSRTVVLGSTNWNDASLNKNIEASVLINSNELAAELQKHFKAIKFTDQTDAAKEPDGPATSIAREFLENSELGAMMVRDHAEMAFDIYLFFLKMSENSGGGTMTLSYEDIAKYLGIYDKTNVKAYKKPIVSALNELEKTYKLVLLQPRYAKDPGVRFLPLVGSREKGEAVFLPETYFDYSWNRTLSLEAKFCYLVNLACAKESDAKPYWRKNTAMIIKEFGNIGYNAVLSGMEELRRRKLMDMEFDVAEGRSYDERLTKRNKVLPLYDPRLREAELKNLEKKYEADVFVQARGFAESVCEENNPVVIEEIIRKIKLYGIQKTAAAFAAEAGLKANDPKKTYRYAIGQLERMD